MNFAEIKLEDLTNDQDGSLKKWISERTESESLQRFAVEYLTLLKTELQAVMNETEDLFSDEDVIGLIIRLAEEDAETLYSEEQRFCEMEKELLEYPAVADSFRKEELTNNVAALLFLIKTDLKGVLNNNLERPELAERALKMYPFLEEDWDFYDLLY